MLLLLGMAPAFAHNVSDYPANGWQYSPSLYTRNFYTAPVSWPTDWNARADDAMATWTAVAGDGLVFNRAGVAGQDAGWVCGDSYDFLNDAETQNGVLAATTLCPDSNSTVRMRFNVEDYDWYHGASTPNTSTLWDMQGVMTHELGHVHQAWAVCTSGGPFDPCPGNHYDSTYNGAICDSSDLANSSTMCQDLFTIAASWRERTLETHDEDLAAGMY